MGKKFYITTTLPYVNAEPHLGFALELIQADVLARYHRLLGDEVFFNTGTDEHGLKIYQKAKEAKKPPQVYVDELATKFNRLKGALNLSYNSFIRTTEKRHLKAAQEFWRRCVQKGDIYKAKYKIKYCVGCELAKTDSELIEGRCPLHPQRNLEMIEEENYFFKFSKYQEPLLKFYTQHPNFIIPSSRFKEIQNFVASGLQDFSISRIKEKMPWGVPVPGDPEQVMYVWFDALVNYVTAVGWPTEARNFKKWWPAVQIAGKDNLRQQAAMWQAMLMSAGLPNSRQILIHGFITIDGQKISKSLGNVIDPFVLVENYGVDALRYYLLKEFPPFNDADFNLKHFQEVYNADLANGLGNLVQRLAKLAERANFSVQISNLAFKIQNYPKIKNLLAAYKFNEVLILLWEKLAKIDKYLNEEKPWTKTDEDLRRVLQKPVRELQEVVFLLQPFLPKTAKKIDSLFKQKKITMPVKPLFPRIK